MPKKRFFLLLSTSLLLITIAACGPSDDQPPAPSAETTTATATPTINSTDSDDSASTATENSNAYPAPAQEDTAASYPAPEINTEPPDVTVEMPETAADRSSVGGVLIRNTTEEGFIPLSPVELYLGEIVYTDSGEPAFLQSSEDGTKAALLDTGVFIFQNIPPGTYGLVIDLGFGQFPVNGDDGAPLLFTLEPGEARNLGLVQVKLPTD